MPTRWHGETLRARRRASSRAPPLRFSDELLFDRSFPSASETVGHGTPQVLVVIQMAKPQRIPTLAAVATQFGVSETTVYKAKRRFSDFPVPTDKGYLASDVESFCKRNSLWHHRPAAGAGREELRAVTIQKLLAQAANLEVTNTRLRELQRKELANCLLRSDVNEALATFREVVLGVLANSRAEIARLMPDDADGTKAETLSMFDALVTQAVALLKSPWEERDEIA